MRSDSQKRDRTRYDFDPIPASAPVEGAFGHTAEASEQDRSTYDRESERNERS
ncbi:MAG TPA: hypothetical protein VN493_10515 [Thermoanaerobaculia bacterium]|nr:hypothetical protein [Thermoanaerobaculia bacterium]